MAIRVGGSRGGKIVVYGTPRMAKRFADMNNFALCDRSALPFARRRACSQEL